MNSPHQREQLPALLSDALNETERARVESHLAECAQCQRELRALQLMQSTLASMPTLPAPERVRAGVRAALRQNSKQAGVLPVVNATDRARADKRSDASLIRRPVQPRTVQPRTLSPVAKPRRSSQLGSKTPWLPFALPTRSLAWGGAVALSAIGLMLLARPSLQDSSFAPQSARSEADFASDAASGANATAANATAANALTDSETAANGSGIAANSVAGNAVTPAQRGTTDASRIDGASAQKRSNPATVPGTSGVGADAQLPSLPPPPQSNRPAAPSVQPENMAPIPSVPAPSASLDLFPPLAPPPKTTSRPPTKKTRPAKPPIIAPKTQAPQPAAPATKIAPPKQTPPAQPSSQPKNAPTTQAKPSAKIARPDGEAASLEAEPKQRSGESSDFAPNASFMEPARPAPARVAPVPAPFADAEGDRAETSSNAGRAEARSPATSPPNAGGRSSVGSPQVSRRGRDASPEWTGGRVSATLARRAGATGEKTPFVLTLGVTKSIGYARLFLMLPSGEQQVWRGTLNALPVQIELPSAKFKGVTMRSGQMVRARLEQTDGFGNPKSDTKFNLAWP